MLVHKVYLGPDEPFTKSENDGLPSWHAHVARYMTLCQTRGRPVRALFMGADQQYLFQDCARVTGKPEVVSRRADLRHYFRLADDPP